MKLMLNIRQFTCQICALHFVLWSVNGTYYVKPTGRYEISETPLPTSVIEQIQKNQFTLVQGLVSPTGALVQTATATPLPKAPMPGCPAPSTCPCPCPQPSSGIHPSALRLIPNTGNSSQNCPHLCICICVGVISPKTVKPSSPGKPLDSKADSSFPVSLKVKPLEFGSILTNGSFIKSSQLAGTHADSSAFATEATPTVPAAAFSKVSVAGPQ
ncbi:uncharacterized protein [Montipora foliosa]|uniref:uncharacterized protein n=1 Tax=Montipora foliosa TaxID=591990 RepID=UPI0035F15D08